DLRTKSTQLANGSRAGRSVDVRVRRVGQTIGVAQPGPDVERVTIRILLEPERLVEKRRRRRASLDRAEVLAAHELQVPIALGLVIENLWSSGIDDPIDPGRIHEHDSQLGCSCIFFKTALLEPDPSVPLQTIGIVVDGGRVSKCSPQIMEIRAKR